jgi:hypothetical protein
MLAPDRSAEGAWLSRGAEVARASIGGEAA